MSRVVLAPKKYQISFSGKVSRSLHVVEHALERGHARAAGDADHRSRRVVDAEFAEGADQFDRVALP